MCDLTELEKIENIMKLMKLLNKNSWSIDQNVMWGQLGQQRLLLNLDIDSKIFKRCDVENKYGPDFMMFDDEGMIPVLRIELETLVKQCEKTYDKKDPPLRCFKSRTNQLSYSPLGTIYISQYHDCSSILVADASDVLGCPDDTDSEFYNLETIRNKIMFFNNDILGLKLYLLEERSKRMILKY